VELINILNNNNSYSNSVNNLKPIAIAIEDKKIDLILDENKDLYPDDYRKWHAKYIKQFGDELWLRCASTARQEGRDVQRYFVWLLNRH